MVSAERQAQGLKDRIDILRKAHGDGHPEVVAYDAANPQPTERVQDQPTEATIEDTPPSATETSDPDNSRH